MVRLRYSGRGPSEKITAHLGILVELVSSNVIDREDNFDVVLLSLLNQRSDLFSARSIEQRVADLIARGY